MRWEIIQVSGYTICRCVDNEEKVESVVGGVNLTDEEVTCQESGTHVHHETGEGKQVGLMDMVTFNVFLKGNECAVHSDGDREICESEGEWLQFDELVDLSLMRRKTIHRWGL